MSSNLCPKKILELPKNFTKEDLKRQYKKMVIKMHPDMKNVSDISSTANFQILTTCYKILLDELEKQKRDKDFVDLKKESKTYVKSQQRSTNKQMNPDSFNITKFNELFTNVRIPNPYDEGYDKWMEENKNTKNDGQIVKYKEPEANVSSTLDGFLLGVDKITDFSGENMSDKSLNFMDYRIAYTTPTIEKNLDKMDKRKEYKSLDALEKDRSAIRFEPDKKTIEEVERRKKIEEIKEKIRLQNITKRDSLIQDNFNKSHGAFLSLR